MIRYLQWMLLWIKVARAIRVQREAAQQKALEIIRAQLEEPLT